MFCNLIYLFFFFFLVSSQIGSLIFLTQDLQTGLLDPTTGRVLCQQPLPFPAPISPDCSWKLAAGTRGQTNTIFYANQTYFFVAQEICNTGKIQQTVVFQSYGSACSTGTVSLRSLYLIDPAAKTEDINISWDHSCNVIVLQPEYMSASMTIHTNQVSEYDAQIRPSPDYLVEPTGDCGNCWRKVPGLGALDAGIWASTGSSYWNCGDSCIFYTLEEHIIDNEAVYPRALIGRRYRTGNLAVNLTDSLQIQSFSWNPWNQYHQNQFIGLGICCNQIWCHPGCQGINGHVVLFSFDSNSAQFSILSDVSNLIDPDTFMMSVEFSPAYSISPQKQAYVFIQNSVISFDLSLTNGVITKATKVQQTPPIDQQNIIMWIAGRGV